MQLTKMFSLFRLKKHTSIDWEVCNNPREVSAIALAGGPFPEFIVKKYLINQSLRFRSANPHVSDLDYVVMQLFVDEFSAILREMPHTFRQVSMTKLICTKYMLKVELVPE